MILIILIIATLIMIFRKKKQENFDKFKACINLPDIPSANSIFNDVKKDVENLANNAIKPIKKTIDDAKNSIESVFKDITDYSKVLGTIRFEKR